jgi:hypothetical protein
VPPYRSSAILRDLLLLFVLNLHSFVGHHFSFLLLRLFPKLVRSTPVVSSYQWRAGGAADLFAAEKRAWGLRSYGFNSLLVGGTELALVSVVFLL